MLRTIKNLIKHKLLKDFSLRSDLFGRAHMADLAVRFAKVNDVSGSYLEFGVFRGSTFSNFYHLFKRYNMQVNMYAFDSFQGLPQPKGLDATPGFDQFLAGEFSCSEREFIDQLRARGVPRSAYTIVPGFFKDSLSPELYGKLNLAKAAIVWIDCDLYESTKPVLDFALPLLQDGTVLIFDDYFCFKGNPGFGERRAFNEFLEKNRVIEATDYGKFSSVGQSFIINLRY